MGKRYKIGVIGLGARAETFVRQLHAGSARAELFGVCDIDADRMRKFLDYCGVGKTRMFTDPEDFMRQPDMDAVVITTPDFAHLEMARLAFAAGKHTYLEKPLEVTAERCREILRAHRESRVTAFVGFNLRASPVRQKIKEIVTSGLLGQIIHVDGLEQTSAAHCASFFRRFHRFEKQSGGWLNTKCCHDLDIMLWTVGHEHKVVKVASFGGRNVFLPAKRPAKTCHECPSEIHRECPYRDQAGFVFPVGGPHPIHKTQDLPVYGGDLCVYNDEAEIVDNQTVILEWDHGVRGSFNLQGFQAHGRREARIWGEKGFLGTNNGLEVVLSGTGERIQYSFERREGGHGGTDPMMLSRFLDDIEAGGASDSGLEAGFAATLVATKALEALKTGQVVYIRPEEYSV